MVAQYMQAVKWGLHLRFHELFEAAVMRTVHFSAYIFIE
jgi:hypothetical protein